MPGCRCSASSCRAIPHSFSFVQNDHGCQGVARNAARVTCSDFKLSWEQ